MKMLKRGLALVGALLLVLGTMGAFAAQGNAIKTAKINKTNFPDPRFRRFVREELDWDKNNVLDAGEIEWCFDIDVSNKGISDLKGIEYFVRIGGLNCEGNKLTRLDLSRNLELDSVNCNKNKLVKLDLSKNGKLKFLQCENNRLNKLIVSRNTELEMLMCGHNKLTKLTLGTKKKLNWLSCDHNQIKTLNVKNCGYLKALAKTKPIKMKEDGKKIAYWSNRDLHYLIIDASTKLTAGRKVLYK